MWNPKNSKIISASSTWLFFFEIQFYFLFYFWPFDIFRRMAFRQIHAVWAFEDSIVFFIFYCSVRFAIKYINIWQNTSNWTYFHIWFLSIVFKDETIEKKKYIWRRTFIRGDVSTLVSLKFRLWWLYFSFVNFFHKNEIPLRLKAVQFTSSFLKLVVVFMLLSKS